MTTRTSVLVIDRDDAVRIGYAAILAASRCDAHTAPDAAGAIAAMEQRHYDAVLLDLGAADGGSMALLRALKRRWPECEVVVIAAAPSVDDAKEAVRLGAFDYLAKPVAPAEVVAALQRAVRSKRFALRPQLTH